MKKFEKGKIISVSVTGITSFGIFVTCDDYYTGLIHISEVSDGFVKNIHDYVYVGETINAKIIDCDDQLGRLSLSIKGIDYRHKNAIKRRRLKETRLGFSSLKYYLPIWIDESLKRIENLPKIEK